MSNVIKQLLAVSILLTIGFCKSGIANTGTIDYKYLLEEEKLARDVYFTLGEKWKLQIFYNIESSESYHIKMVKSILESNNIQFDVISETGKFKNSEIQKLYDSLIQKGLKSVKDALEVGLAIEDMDIADLESLITNSKTQSDIDTLNALLNASMRHKSAFTRNLKKY